MAPLTEFERRQILDRDQNKCNFPACPKKGGNKKINCTENLNVHHIQTQRYCEKYNVDPNYPENLISICEGSHIGSPDGVHPDTQRAREEYRKGNKNAFKEMAKARDERLKNKTPCWNTEYDRAMITIAARNTQVAEKKSGWIFRRSKKKDEVDK